MSFIFGVVMPVAAVLLWLGAADSAATGTLSSGWFFVIQMIVIAMMTGWGYFLGKGGIDD